MCCTLVQGGCDESLMGVDPLKWMGLILFDGVDPSRLHRTGCTLVWGGCDESLMVVGSIAWILQ